MGRTDPPNSTTQYYQGLQFQELHQNQAPATTGDAPLPPPPDSPKKPKKTDQARSTFPPSEQPQAFPPPQDFHEAPQAFPPQEPPQAFPPPQSFPPQQGFHHQPQPQQNFNFHQQSPQPAVNFHQHGGVPMGHPMAGPSPMPSPFPGQQVQNQPWKSGLFDCMNDPENAIITACFPCVTFGQIAEVVDSGATSCATSGILYGCIAFWLAVPFIMSCTYRTKIRSRFGLVESPAPDWLVHCCCEWCALCQEYRELKARDLDPSIGWQGNLAKQQQQQRFAMAPPMQQRMM